MKLYTEEQVKEAMKNAIIYYEVSGYDNMILNALTSIELPSDEEIEKNADINTVNINEHIVFIIGAKWAIRQILNQNK